MENISENYNDEIRENIIKLSTIYGMDYYRDLIANNVLDDSTISYPYAYATMNIIFLDAYKSLKQRLTSGNLSINEFELFSLLKDSNSFENIKNFYSILRSHLDVSIAYSIEFNESTELGKKVYVKGLDEEDNKYLLKIAPMHENDLLYYGKEINTDWLNDFYDSYLNELDENYTVYDSSLVKKLISGSLLKISNNNRGEIYRLISSISKEVFDTNNSNIFDESSRIGDLCNIYRHDKKLFINTCLNDERILNILIDLYFSIKKDNLLIKKLKKD